MEMKRIWILIMAVAVWMNATAVVGYDKLNEKAERFVQFQEWNSANAMYLLMLEQKHNSTAVFSRAIVTSGLIHNEKAQIELLEQTQKQGLPLDSVFTGVSRFAYEIGESQEYERFLQLVKNRQSWLTRPINIRLLDYYAFRNDANNMVATGNELLAGTPDDTGYLSTVARGYMLLGDFENSVATYKRILEIVPQDYDALIALANYYYMVWKESEGTRSQFVDSRDNAIAYFEQANALRPTPFVTRVLNDLKNEN